jgi:hypothetical protein
MTGIETIAFVWSFNNKMNDIPYRIELREGAKPRKTCTCPAFSFSGGKTCKHITALKAGVKDKSILSDERFQLTDFGKQYLKQV